MSIDPNRVKEIFLEAAELSDEAVRVAYLDQACGSDAGLRDRVEALLQSHDPDGSFLGTPVAVVPNSDPDGTIAFNSSATGDGAESQDLDDEPYNLKFLSPPTRPDSLGRLGHYEVLQVLGKGGFGIVFRAFDDILQRVVAVKVMAPELAATSPARKRFLREARSSAAVRHENVVQVYEVCEHPLPYLVMEFIPGETLQQKLDRSGPLDVLEVLKIGRQVAEGLAAAHACDLIHRDIKPGNILLEGGSHKVKITDFGLARAADDASISQSGIVAGTPMFMAPEQALGHKIDQRADLFSLGSVLYQMVSGRPPFRAPSTLAVLKRVAEEPPRPIPEIIPETPDWLCGIIAKLHAKNPDDRFQSAREVADLLADCEAKVNAKQALKNILPAAVKPAGRKWVAAAAVLLLPVIALAVTEFAGVTQLFRRPQATTNPIKPGGEPTPVPGAIDSSDAEGWVKLFNRKDLTGWKMLPEAPGHWVVKDGILIGSQRRSNLFSERADYANFHLRVEAKVNLGGDSGILFRTGLVPRGTDGGYEAEIRGYGRKTGTISALQGEAAPLILGMTTNDSLIQPDEWFTFEIIAEQDDFITRVNGKETENCRDPLNRCISGDLALQVWSPNTVVQFRKIEIKELPPTSPPAAKQAPLLSPFKNSIGMEFVIVPKGKSWLGGGKDKLGDQEVEIPADFYLGKYEVTQEEWEKVMGENPSHFSRTGEGKDAVKDIPDADLKLFPVENVTWDQIQLFVAKLNTKKETAWVYRLPKEEEWEYACRGGPMSDKLEDAFDFYFARPTNILLPEQANFNESGLNRTCKVGSYKPNKLGLYDMHGNVWDWCDDLFDPKGSDRVSRCGGWRNVAVDCVVMRRSWPSPGFRAPDLGFRLARVPVGAPSPEVKPPPTAVAALREAVAEKERFRNEVKQSHLDGKSTPLEVIYTEIDLCEARISLTQAEGNAAANIAAYRELVFFREREHEAIAQGVKAGLSKAADLERADSSLGDVRGRLAKALAEAPVTATFTDADIRRIAALPAAGQVEEVRKALMRLNPKFDGTLTPTIENNVVSGLKVLTDEVDNLAPLRALRNLTHLDCRGTYRDKGKLFDLSPLKGMSLNQLDCSSTQVSDLTPLTGMPLTNLQCNHNPVDDLTPLKNMPLEVLGCAETKVSDFSPLKGLKLKTLGAQLLPVTDLSPLEGMPLTGIDLYGTTGVTHLKALAGMPLEGLNIQDLPVSDLSPLKGMTTLRTLQLAGNKVSDLSPLQGLNLTDLILHDEQITDLSPLKGLPLTRLVIYNTGVRDLTPLQGMPLEEIRLNPKNITQGLDILRDIQSLKTIGIDGNQTWPPAEFWERYDKGDFTK